MYRIGVDLGGTNIAVGIVDENAKLLIKESTPTLAQREADLIIKDMADLCIKLCEKLGIDIHTDVASVGVASPGIADHNTGVVVYSCNLPFNDYPIAKKLSEFTGIENVHLENDANAAAWGEAIAGAAKGTANSLMITLGTGVGGGIIINNKVYSGFNCAGAEIGHFTMVSGGRKCGCGRNGCFEAYCSATALVNMTREKLEECEQNGRQTVMSDLVKKYGKVSGRTAFDALRAGDKAGEEVVDSYLGYLASGIASMINIFSPEVISIGGGISGEGQFLLDRLAPLVKAEQAENKYVKPTELKVAALGNDAGIIGAATLGIN